MLEHSPFSLMPFSGQFSLISRQGRFLVRDGFSAEQSQVVQSDHGPTWSSVGLACFRITGDFLLSPPHFTSHSTLISVSKAIEHFFVESRQDLVRKEIGSS